MALILAGCVDHVPNPPSAAQIRADAATVVDPREIVALVPTLSAAANLRTGAVTQGFTLREETVLAGLGLHMLRFQIAPALDGPAAIAALERIETSATAGLNHAYRPAETQASRLDYANALIAWPTHPCRALGPIGMLDTGVNAALPELASVHIVQASFARGAAASTRHGTEVAVLLADPSRLTEVSLYAADVIATTSEGHPQASVDSLLRALDWMAAKEVRLVNVSLAGPYNKLLDLGIGQAAARGMTIVAAVGNDGVTANPRYPAALENVIAVTALDAHRAIYRSAVRGDYVDVAAPGVDVKVTMDGQSRFASGTSIAAPFVTARIVSDPHLYKADAGLIRRSLAAITVDLGTPGHDPVFGSGLIMADPACGA